MHLPRGLRCDPTPFAGDQGCSAVFGPQKGADPGMIMQMDKWLAYYAALAREKYEKANPRQAGTGRLRAASALPS